MTLYLLRHAESESNFNYTSTKKNVKRITDPNITKKGKEQALYLAEFLKNGNDLENENRSGFTPIEKIYKCNITQLFCSPMHRSIQTAIPIANRLKIPLTIMEISHEFKGIWNFKNNKKVGLKGLSRNEISSLYSEVRMLDNFDSQSIGWWNEKSVETNDMAIQRAYDFIDFIQAKFDDKDRIGIVSHCAFINRILRALVGSKSEDFPWFSLHNCSTIKIEFSEKKKTIVYINKVDYIPIDLQT